MQLYDSNKKGTIIVGHMRSGTHYLMSLIKNLFLANNMTYTYNVEYFGNMYGPIKDTENKYSFFNIIDRLKDQDKSLGYSLGSIVFPTALDMISQNKTNYQYFMENYHVVKMIRKDIMAQLMSVILFDGTKHSNITSITELDVQVPYTLSNTLLIRYSYGLLELERFKGHETVYYEDLPQLPVPNFTKNKYGITPKEFFTNYDEIITCLRQLNITHYEL
jgi:hypothetical protein